MFKVSVLRNAVKVSAKYQHRSFKTTAFQNALEQAATTTTTKTYTPIVPAYWKAENLIPEHKYTIDCMKYDLANKVDMEGKVNIPKSLIERVKAMYDSVGLVHLINTGLTETETMRQLSKIIIKNPMTYKAGANSRDGIIENVYEVRNYNLFISIIHTKTQV